MRRRVAVPLLVSLLSLATTVTPAEASSDGVCTGWGTMATSAPVKSLLVSPNQKADVNWSFSFTVGLCVDTNLTLPFLSAAGRFTGWCDYSFGYGVTSNGHRFVFTGLGPRLFFSGEVVGEIPFFPDTVSGHSCATGASFFFVGHGATLLVD